MVLRRVRYSVRRKFIVYNKLIEDVSLSSWKFYLGCDVTFDISLYRGHLGEARLRLVRTKWHEPRNKRRKETRLNFHRGVSVSWQRNLDSLSEKLRFRNSCWNDTFEISTRLYEIRCDFNVTSITEYISFYRGERLVKMDESRLPNMDYQYKPDGKTDVARFKQRWKI